MKITEKRSVSIVSCNITPQLIQDSTAIIREGAMRLTKDAFAHMNDLSLPEKATIDRHVEFAQTVDVTVETPITAFQFATPEELKGLRIPVDVTRISISSGNEGTVFYALIRFDFLHPISQSVCSFSLKGGNRLILDGVVTTLENRLLEARTANGFAYRLRYNFAVSMAIVLPAFWLVYRALELTWKVHIDFFMVVIFVVVLAFFFLVQVERLFAWLFPYFSYPSDRRENTRRRVKAIFIAISTGLVIAGIYDAMRVLVAVLGSG